LLFCNLKGFYLPASTRHFTIPGGSERLKGSTWWEKYKRNSPAMGCRVFQSKEKEHFQNFYVECQGFKLHRPTTAHEYACPRVAYPEHYWH
jgi:hypothetical protein